MKAKRYYRSLFFLCILAGFTMSSGLANSGDAEHESQIELAPSVPVGTGFTYQGELQDISGPVSGTCDIRFALWDAANGGSQLGGTIDLTGITLDNGLFTANLDFGDRFKGDARWLEIGVRCPAGSGSYTLMTPRQLLSPAPYALYALHANRDHTHLGQEWSSSLRGLTIESTANDAMQLSARWVGLRIASADDGIVVSSADNDGVKVLSSGNHAFYAVNTTGSGLDIDRAGRDGVNVLRSGNPSTISMNDSNDGFEIGGAEGNGVWIGHADGDGVKVNSAGVHGIRVINTGQDGLHIWEPGRDGLRVYNAASHGVQVFSAGNDGVRINDANEDGVQIGDGTNFPLYGFYIPSPGVPYTALWPRTANTNGEWALYTSDKIYAGNVTTSTMTMIAQVDSHGTLSTGDLVTVVGMADPITNSLSTIPLIDLNNDSSLNGVIGVIDSRMVLEQAVNKEEGDLVFNSVPGLAEDGDYVSLVVYGIAQVKVDPSANNITPGQRLTLSELSGHTRALRSELMNGMVVSEGTQIVGIALEAPVQGKTTIPVFVTLR